MTLADEQCSTRPTVQQEDAAEHVPLQRAVGPSLQGNGNADPPACQATTTQPCSSIAAHQQHQLSLGDPVSVKAQTELAWISSFDPPPQYEGRWQVRYADGKTRWCRPAHIRPVYPTRRRLLVCPTTREYRTAMIHNAFPTDVCLEVGCHEGITTSMLAARVASVVGVDVAAQPVEDARRRFPNCRFEVCNGLDTDALQKLSPRAESRHPWDKIFVDVGGIAPLTLVGPLVYGLRRAFASATIIVKSVHLSRLIDSSEVFAYDSERTWAKPYSDAHR